MNQVYIVRAFDGESSSILKVFLSEDKANEYAKKYEKEQEKNFGFKYDTCYVDMYEVIK